MGSEMCIRDREYDTESRGWAAGWARVSDALGAEAAAPEMPRERPPKLNEAAQAMADAAASGRRAKQAQNTPALAAPLLSALDPDELVMPHVPSRQETEEFILTAKKEALRKECA